MKIETFTVSIACHKLVTREELAAALRTAAGDQGVYYVEVEGPQKAADEVTHRQVASETPHVPGRGDKRLAPQTVLPRPPGAKRRGRPPKAATADPKPPIEPAPKPKRRYTRGLKTDEERGVPVTHRTCADGTKVETRGRCPGGATP